MIESLNIGSVSCNFLTPDDFDGWCRQRLSGTTLSHVVTLNPEMIMEAQTNPVFRKALEAASLRVPDGSGLVWARWYLRSAFWSLWPSLLAFPFIHAQRVTGVDAVVSIAKLAEKENKTIYLLGGTIYQSGMTAKFLRTKFPALKIHTSPAHNYVSRGPESILREIEKQRPDIILVAYGAPKQTIWIRNNEDRLVGVKLVVGVGGAFAILSEDKPRAPHWLRRLNLEWLWRLVLEPKRLPRIWRATISFPLLINRQKHAAKTALDA